MRFKLTTKVFLPKFKAFESLTGGQKRKVLLSMAEEFAKISRANFGPTGKDRVSRWMALSPKYRRWKVKHGGKPIADLELSGKLKNSIKATCNSDAYAEVSAGEGTDYARAHQFGLGDMPYRPFLPTNKAGKPTPYTAKRLKQVAELEIKRLVK